MPIAIQSTSHASPSPSRPVLQNLRDSNPRLSNLRDSKGFAVRIGIRSANIRSIKDGVGSSTNRFAPNPEGRTLTLEKSRFARLPHEPEDARITGTTRSLPRRLLALNLSGTLQSRPARSVEHLLFNNKIA